MTSPARALAAICLFSAGLLHAETLTPVPTRDNKIIHRWQLPGDPHGVAAGPDGTIYAGLAQPQAIVAIDPATGEIRKRVVLDSAEIAATKELVTIRLDSSGKRMIVANGSDESAMILSVPDLTVLREITMEGEQVRDAAFDPKGRYVYVLGRRLHVYDATGERELHKLDLAEPMAMAPSANGNLLALIGTHDFGNGKVTVAAMYDTGTFKELDREPMQTDKSIEAAMWVAGDHALVAIGRDHLYEKAVKVSGVKKLESSGGTMRMTIDFGDLTNSERVCLPEGSGPQIATAAAPPLLIFAERRCSSGDSFSGSGWKSTPASIYGISAYAMAYEPKSNSVFVTDRAGFLTAYRVPRSAPLK